MDRFEHLISKCRQASAVGIDALSHGEALAAALVLNRADWLASMNYTIAEALGRIDDDWIAMIPRAAKLIAESNEVLSKASRSSAEEMVLHSLGEEGAATIDVRAKLITAGDSPGYRSVSLEFDIQSFNSSASHRLCFSLSLEDTEAIREHIEQAHRFAWRRGAPLDIRAGETKPRWLDR